MQINIDWLSFTVKREVQDDDTELSALSQVLTAVNELYDGFFDVMLADQPTEWRAGRKPYNASWSRADGGVAVFIHKRLDHALIEVSGRGCGTLGEYHDAPKVLDAIKHRLTRFDLACDMLNDVDPLEFVAQRVPGRFKAHSEVVSESGTTAYVGSRTSNRYARVYRYNPPHERAHLLRCEFVLKAEDAKLTAAAILEHGHYSAGAALGTQFGWEHPSWSVDPPTEVELRAYRPDRREGKTLYWLADTVAPLLVRLHEEGTINVNEWFATEVLHILEKSGKL